MDKGKAPLNENDDDLVSMYFDVDKFPSSEDDLGLAGNEMPAGAAPSHVQAANPSANLDELAPSFGRLPMPASRKLKSAARLVEAVLADPQRARRMISNRQSAARSRERGRYVVALEQTVDRLQKEAAALSAHLFALNQRNIDLAFDNQQLKLRQRELENEIELQTALNKNLEEELLRLRFEKAQFGMHGRPMMDLTSSSLGRNQQYNYKYQVPYSFLVNYNLQQAGLHSLQQQQNLQQPQQPCSAMTNDGLLSSQSQSLENSDVGSSSNE